MRAHQKNSQYIKWDKFCCIVSSHYINTRKQLSFIRRTGINITIRFDNFGKYYLICRTTEAVTDIFLTSLVITNIYFDTRSTTVSANFLTS
jgi:hypothetical protein